MNLILGTYGNFDIAGTATISVPIQSGTFSAGTTNPYGFTLTGGGTLTLGAIEQFLRGDHRQLRHAQLRH